MEKRRILLMPTFQIGEKLGIYYFDLRIFLNKSSYLFNISLPPNQSAVGRWYMKPPWFITKRTRRKYKYWESTTILISMGHASTCTIYGCVCFLHLELCSYIKFCMENQWSSVTVMLMKTWLLYTNKCHLILMNNNVVETKFKWRSQSLLIMVPAHVGQRYNV